jgi:dephospho-CoA kinase
MAKLIIGITGEMASGKTFSARYLAEKYQAESCRFSTPMREIASRLYLDSTRENLAALSLALRQTFGEDLFSRVIAHDAERFQSGLVIIDGVRRLADIAALQKLPQFILLYIESDPKVRYSRLTSRGENADDFGKTWEQFEKDQQLETETQIRSLKKAASVVITNNDSAEELYQALDKIISEKLKN